MRPGSEGLVSAHLSLHLAFGEGRVSTPSRPSTQVASVRFLTSSCGAVADLGAAVVMELCPL